MYLSRKLFFSLIIVGILSGITGIVLSHVLHWIQHHAYHYALNGQEMSFLAGVTQASVSRRVLLLGGCGFLVGVGWYILHRYVGTPVSIQAAVKQPFHYRLPLLSTLYHGLLQIVTVGLGSPLGREVAPREISAALATWWCDWGKFNEEDTKLLIACAAGSGLAAIYNVPMAGIIFTLETLLLSYSARAITAAFITSAVATVVSRVGLGDAVQYNLPDAQVNVTLLVWAVVMGPILGGVVYLFKWSTQYFPWLKRDDKRIIVVAIIAFVFIGILAMYFPAILGNGKAGNQLAFAGLIDWQDSLQLMLVKWFVILLALAAGAYGGLITPSMMLGSALATIFVCYWNSLGWAYIPPESAALVGATAFLGVALNMPLTALVFCVELTRVSPAFLFPMILAMMGAYLSYRYLDRS